MSERIKVFISYSHDSEEHIQDVQALADTLINDGILAIIDKYYPNPPEGWPAWMLKQIKHSDYVLVVSSELYCNRFEGEAPPGVGNGAKWEGAIITLSMYPQVGNNTKFIPIVFKSEDKKFIPTVLSGATYYDLSSKKGYEDLYRYLTKQPEIIQPPLGEIKQLNIGVNLQRQSRFMLDEAGKKFSRDNKLEYLERLSIARCKSRWLSSGLTNSEAHDFASDKTIGMPDSKIVPTDEKPIVVLTGEVGSGKSLLAERLFQNALNSFRKNPESPIPVFIQPKDLNGSLISNVEQAVSEFGDLDTNGAIIIIDGADESGISKATQILDESRILHSLYPKSKILITSRPLPSYDNQIETIPIPKLTEQESYALVSKISRIEISPGFASQWPESIKEAIKRPLFAILLGIFLRGTKSKIPRSKGEMISFLVEESLNRIDMNKSDAITLLKRLAMLSTDRGGNHVHFSELASKIHLQSLFGSGMIVQNKDKDYYSFALPILTQWFAAQSLISEMIKIEDIANDSERLELWKYPLIIYVGSADYNKVIKAFSYVIEKHPAFASQIVDDALADWGICDDVVLPSYIECGRRIRESMQTWVNGIGRLAKLIAPVNENNKVLPIGVNVEKSSIVTAWYYGSNELNEVVPIPDEAFLYYVDGWPTLRHAFPGYQSSWALKWTKKELEEGLNEIIDKKLFPVYKGPLLREVAWIAATTITGKHSQTIGKIKIQEILKLLSQFPPESRFVKFNNKIINLEALRIELQRLQDEKQDSLIPPWPIPDKINTGGWIWKPYSDSQFLARAQAVFSGAVEGYQHIIDTWLPTFASRMSTYILFPAKLKCFITRETDDNEMFPTKLYYFQAIPKGSSNQIDIQICDQIPNLYDISTEKLYAEARRLRPEASQWLSVSVTSGYLDIFHETAISDLVYSWLKRDLKRISWVN